jgi:hypothetical protein
MANESYLVDFKPGRVFTMPRHAGSKSGSYLFLQGRIAFTPEGIMPQDSGVAAEVFPILMGGKPGGMLRISGAFPSRIEGNQGFAGQYLIEMHGRKGLLIKALPGGRFVFFLGPKGGVAVQLQPTPFNKLRLVPQSAQAHPMTVA